MLCMASSYVLEVIEFVQMPESSFASKIVLAGSFASSVAGYENSASRVLVQISEDGQAIEMWKFFIEESNDKEKSKNNLDFLCAIK